MSPGSRALKASPTPEAKDAAWGGLVPAAPVACWGSQLSRVRSPASTGSRLTRGAWQVPGLAALRFVGKLRERLASARGLTSTSQGLDAPWGQSARHRGTGGTQQGGSS